MLANMFSVTRRELLSVGAAGALGAVSRGFGPEACARAARALPLSCVCLFNSGGMSHVDLWDPKPDAPREIRGEFAPIETSVPGVYLSELLPQTARWAHKLTIVRSVTHAEVDHARARRLIGEAGHRGLKIANLHLADRPPASAAFLETDSPADLEQACRTACRNVASGCRFVGIANGHWDTHSRNAWALKEILAPAFDRAFAGLIAELDAHGRLDSTLVVVATEFGRSPRIDARGGRDHWPAAFSIVLAGAGVPAGPVIGRTDRLGERVVDEPVECPIVTSTAPGEAARSRPG